MVTGKSAHWRKLDNAAKIFPATTDKKDTRVFRFYCVLKEMIVQESLQHALDLTMEKYPTFLSVLRKGFFWYYFEKSTLKPIVREERRLPCSTIYVEDKKKLLFKVTYYKNRVNFEVFHALTDGTGATQFLKELVKQYLLEIHGGQGLPDISLVEDTITKQDQAADSFSKYYSKDAPKISKNKLKSYQIKGQGTEYGELQITEVITSVKEVLEKARSYEVSITVFLTSVYLCAIQEEMSIRQKKKPIILMVPVNLRKFFPSESMLNFFGWIEVGYEFQDGENTFEDILQNIKREFEKELTKERIAARMNKLMALEQNPVLRAAPLGLKNIGMKLGTRFASKDITAVYSNMSVVSMPKEYCEYIEYFGVFTSTPKMELCMCSFQDELVLGFTSRKESTNIERNFLRILQEMQLHGKIQEPSFPSQDRPAYLGARFFQWFSFLCIVGAVIATMVNIMVTPHNDWAIFVIGGILSMWLALAIGFVKRYNLLKNAMWQLGVVTAGSIVWDVMTGWNRWSVDYVVPGVSVTILMSIVIISKVQKMGISDYMIYYVMSAAFGLIPGVLLLTGVVKIIYPSVICAGLCFLFLAALFIFRGKDFVKEMHKNLHV